MPDSVLGAPDDAQSGLPVRAPSSDSSAAGGFATGVSANYAVPGRAKSSAGRAATAANTPEIGKHVLTL